MNTILAFLFLWFTLLTYKTRKTMKVNLIKHRTQLYIFSKVRVLKHIATQLFTKKNVWYTLYLSE